MGLFNYKGFRGHTVNTRTQLSIFFCFSLGSLVFLFLAVWTSIWMAAHGFFSMICVAGICPKKPITRYDFWGAVFPTSFLREIPKPAYLRLFRERELVSDGLWSGAAALLLEIPERICSAICHVQNQPFQPTGTLSACWGTHLKPFHAMDVGEINLTLFIWME